MCINMECSFMHVIFTSACSVPGLVHDAGYVNKTARGFILCQKYRWYTDVMPLSITPPLWCSIITISILQMSKPRESNPCLLKSLESLLSVALLPLWRAADQLWSLHPWSGMQGEGHLATFWLSNAFCAASSILLYPSSSSGIFPSQNWGLQT